jgi:hypothetical protein
VVSKDQLTTPSPRSTEAEGGGAGRIETRAEVMHALIQRLADLCARLEGRPPQPVPRLDNDLSLPDQLTVMVADLALVGASDDQLEAAIADIEATAERL